MDGWYGPAEMARRLGVSPKALRVFEREGLVRPERSAANYRRYGPAHAQRLHQVLALKRLGLPLRRIGELLAGRYADLDSVLRLQQAMLERRVADAQVGLRLIADARARLARGDALSPDELARLTKETAMTTDKDRALEEALRPAMERHFTPEDRERLTTDAPYFDQEQVSREWDALIAEAKRLHAAGDPGTPAAKDLGRRWFAQVARFTDGDPTVFSKLSAAWGEAMADPNTAPKLPMTPELMAFVGEAKRRADAEG